MITNQSSQTIRPVWSDDLQTYIVYAENLSDCVDGELGLIREGVQTFSHNVTATTKVDDCCNLADCYLRDSDIVFTDTIS